MSDPRHPEHPDYGNAPTAADFCRGCGEERGQSTEGVWRGGLCPGCALLEEVDRTGKIPDGRVLEYMGARRKQRLRMTPGWPPTEGFR